MKLISSLAKQNLSSVFNQRGAEERRVALKKLWAPNGVFWAADGPHIGRVAVDKAAARILRSYPEYQYRITGIPDEIPDVVRMHWSFGRSGVSSAISGLDIIVVSQGRIVALYRFLNGAAL